jgi:metal-responsive CopG/Arc/MetJ family transcriptional regulator
LTTIQVVLDSKLLKAADAAARRVNRSVLIRRALEQHLKDLREIELEGRDRRGYLAQAEQVDEYLPWEAITSWPRR